MLKVFKLTINLEVDIPDKISDDLVKEVISEVDKSVNMPLYLPQTDKHQAFIDYIKNNDNVYEQCITGDLFFQLMEHGLEDELTEFLKPRIFDEIALDVAGKLDSETKNFITRLYGDTENKDIDDIIDEDGNPLNGRISKKQAIEAVKREIDRRIIQDSLLDYKLIDASLKVVCKTKASD